MPVEMDVPFRLGADGRVVTRSDPDAQVRLHVLAMINTTPEERVTVPGYGVPLNRLMFENLDAEELVGQAQTRISSAMGTWEPGVGLTSVVVAQETGENKGVLDVQYYRKASTDLAASASVNTAVIGPGGVIREIVRG